MVCNRDEIAKRVGDASSVLLLAPSLGERDEKACIDLLTKYTPEESNVLSVHLSRTVDERIALWQRELGDRSPKRSALVDAGGAVQPDTRTDGTDESSPFAVDVLSEGATPADIGLVMGRYLGAWESTPESTLYCLHSVSALLDSFEQETVIRLVTALNAFCESADVVGHHHMDPDGYSEQTLSTFRPLYDVVVEHLDGRGWIVSTGRSGGELPTFRGTRSVASESTDAERPGPTRLPHSLDVVLALVSTRRRRVILHVLRDRTAETIGLDQLIDRVVRYGSDSADGTASCSRKRLTSSLVHRHLPKLEDHGLVTYDTDEKTVEYHANPALEDCLDYVERLEHR